MKVLSSRSPGVECSRLGHVGVFCEWDGWPAVETDAGVNGERAAYVKFDPPWELPDYINNSHTQTRQITLSPDYK